MVQIKIAVIVATLLSGGFTLFLATCKII